MNNERPRTGPNNYPVGRFADLARACICKPRDWRASADDDGADFDCPHHGMNAQEVWRSGEPGRYVNGEWVAAPQD